MEFNNNRFRPLFGLNIESLFYLMFIFSIEVPMQFWFSYFVFSSSIVFILYNTYKTKFVTFNINFIFSTEFLSYFGYYSIISLIGFVLRKYCSNYLKIIHDFRLETLSSGLLFKGMYKLSKNRNERGFVAVAIQVEVNDANRVADPDANQGDKDPNEIK